MVKEKSRMDGEMGGGGYGFGGEKWRLGFLFGVSEKMRPKVVSGELNKVYIEHH